ncbi:hypothetical protein Ava_B0303 (plasmid) [Trichormus variabilis ATCC 29413]|uniref:Uncharacterized protein n=2 Tax=Anabaena variabilis TaxID=264691 RepID=Q3M1X3_TRIV2|nr:MULTISPECIES: hypothetical protein [Nostocaceae]ABA25013.1 hypothetical protein Ava_B0303 [Trichormus variabilis ATCC 29413]MBC1217841.1 hypothetical protein [Trichormus variabilis ARAD]MBC1259324.1 hypothetical protein [Trichormus variabilis V5]MBC1270699.1 hypothetical protein [Trichormus variabilis FSR]MBC1305771.1 hypothetical protein [Trichormus variabilis N2B]
MSQDLLIYNGQSNRIDQLIGRYGAYLEALTREIKLLLRITLSTYVLMQQEYSSTEYPVSEALEDALSQLVIPHNVPQDLFDICSQLEGLTVDEAESLLDALQYQLYWGNARITVKQ